MNDLLPALAERLQAVPWTCEGREHCTTTAHGLNVCGWRMIPDYAALAREALVFVADGLPTRDKIADQIAGVLIPYLVAPEPATGTKEHLARYVARAQADAVLRDLRGRLGVKP